MNETFEQLGVTPTSSATATATQTSVPTGSISPEFAALGVVPSGSNSPTPATAPTTAPTPPNGSGNLLAPFAPATGNESPLTAGLKTVANLIPSAINFGVGAVEAPFKGLSDLAQIPSAASAAVSANGGIIPAAENTLSSFLPSAYHAVVPQGLQDIFSGNTKAAEQTLEDDPVGTWAPVVLAGSTGAHAISPEVGAAFDDGVRTMASPITGTASAVGAGIGTTMGKMVENSAAFGAKTVTGLDMNTIKQVVANPDKFSPEEIANTTRATVAQTIKAAIDARQDSISESGQAYAPVRTAATPISVKPNELTSLIQQTTGMEQDPETGLFQRTTEGAVLSSSDVTKINNFYNTWQPRFSDGSMTSGEFLNMRSELAGLAKYEGGIGKSSPLEGAASRMRGSLNATLRPQVPGLEDLDADFASKKTDLDKLSNGLLDGDGNLRDSDINKIANATGKSRSVLLGNLEELVPGITQKLNALKAVEDIRDTVERHKTGTYARAGIPLTAIGTGILTGNAPLIVGGITEAVLSNPDVAIPLLRQFGYSKALVAGVVANLGAVASKVGKMPNNLTKNLPSAFGGFGSDASGTPTPILDSEGNSITPNPISKLPVTAYKSLPVRRQLTVAGTSEPTAVDLSKFTPASQLPVIPTGAAAADTRGLPVAQGAPATYGPDVPPPPTPETPMAPIEFGKTGVSKYKRPVPGLPIIR